MDERAAHERQENDADHAEAVALWNGLTQLQRTQLLLLVLRLHDVVAAEETGLTSVSDPPTSSAGPEAPRD